MKSPGALITALLSHVIVIQHLVSGLVTLQTVRDITNATEECRGRITAKDTEGKGMQVVVGMEGMGQSVLSTGRGDDEGEDVEDVSLFLLLLLNLPIIQFARGISIWRYLN